MITRHPKSIRRRAFYLCQTRPRVADTHRTAWIGRRGASARSAPRTREPIHTGRWSPSPSMGQVHPAQSFAFFARKLVVTDETVCSYSTTSMIFSKEFDTRPPPRGHTRARAFGRGREFRVEFTLHVLNTCIRQTRFPTALGRRWYNTFVSAKKFPFVDLQITPRHELRGLRAAPACGPPACSSGTPSCW